MYVYNVYDYVYQSQIIDPRVALWLHIGNSEFLKYWLIFSAYVSKRFYRFELYHVLYVFDICSDFHQKQAAKKALMRKALDKNPDEFYFKMIRTRMEVDLSFYLVFNSLHLLALMDWEAAAY